MDILHINIGEDDELTITLSNLDEILYTGIEPCRPAARKKNFHQNLIVIQEQQRKRYLLSAASSQSEHLNHSSKNISEITNMDDKIDISNNMGKTLSHVNTTNKKRVGKFNSGKTKRSKNVYSSTVGYGACMDTGAARNVCGIDQACSYFNQTNLNPELKPSYSRLRYTDFMCDSKGIFTIGIPINVNGFIEFKVNMVTADIPLFSGLERSTGKGYTLELF